MGGVARKEGLEGGGAASMVFGCPEPACDSERLCVPEPACRVPAPASPPGAPVMTLL